MCGLVSLLFICTLYCAFGWLNEWIHCHLVFCSCLMLLLMFISVIVEIASKISFPCRAVNTVHNYSKSYGYILNVLFSLCHLSVAGQFFVLECDNMEMFSVHTTCFIFIAVRLAEHRMQLAFSVYVYSNISPVWCFRWNKLDLFCCMTDIKCDSSCRLTVVKFWVDTSSISCNLHEAVTQKSCFIGPLFIQHIFWYCSVDLPPWNLVMHCSLCMWIL